MLRKVVPVIYKRYNCCPGDDLSLTRGTNTGTEVNTTGGDKFLPLPKSQVLQVQGNRVRMHVSWAWRQIHSK